MIAPFVGTNIPQEILDLVQWINWKYDDNGGKRPVNGTSIGGWRSFDVVAADGPTAFVFAAGDPYVGIDLDDCLDQDGNVLDWAVPIVERLRHVAYGEVSPSGTGIKFITRGKKPDGATCSVNKPDCKVECYEERRFWCMTNQVFQAADTIGDGQDAVNWLCETYLSKTRPKVPSVPKRTKKETVGPSLFRRAQAYADKADLVDSGSRNNAAFNLAGNLHAMEDESGRRLDVDQLFSAMQGWNGRLSDPLDSEELRQVCESAMTNGTPRLPKPPGQASGEVSASPFALQDYNLEEFCTTKRIPAIESLEAFNVQVRYASDEDGNVTEAIVVAPMFERLGFQCGEYSCNLGPKSGRKLSGAWGIFIPEDGINGTGPLVIVKDVEEAAAVRSLGYRVIGLSGDASQRQVASIQAVIQDAMDPLDVVFVPTRDNAGTRNAQALKEALDGLPLVKSFRVAELLAPMQQQRGANVREVIASHGGDSVRKSIATAGGVKMDERPKLIVRKEELLYQLNADAMEALGTLGWVDNNDEAFRVYEKDGELVEVVVAPERLVRGVKVESGPRVRPIPTATLAARLNLAVRFFRETRKLDTDSNQFIIVHTEMDPPQAVINHLVNDPLLAMRQLKTLEGVVTAPTFRQDGTVLQEPGYDQATRLVLVPGDYPTVPDDPTLEDARQAATKLLDLVADFPWDTSSHQAAWLSHLLTLLVHRSMPGRAPVFIYTANRRGSGKSKLVQLAHEIAFGAPAPTRGYPHDEEEVRKSITACIADGMPTINFDDVERVIGDPHLQRAVLDEVWEDRPLKTSSNVRLSNRTVFSFTTNNLRYKGDMDRRVLVVKLTTKRTDPEHRTDFRIGGDIVAHVRHHRKELLAAALTILRYRWKVSELDGFGQLRVRFKSKGSLVAWCAWVRDAVVLATDLDPMDTEMETQTANVESYKTAIVHEVIKAHQGFTSAKLLAAALQEKLDFEGEDEAPTVRSMLEVIGCIPEKTDSAAITNNLHPFINNPHGPVGNAEWLKAKPGKAGKMRWWVEKIP